MKSTSRFLSIPVLVGILLSNSHALAAPVGQVSCPKVVASRTARTYSVLNSRMRCFDSERHARSAGYRKDVVATPTPSITHFSFTSKGTDATPSFQPSSQPITVHYSWTSDVSAVNGVMPELCLLLFTSPESGFVQRWDCEHGASGEGSLVLQRSGRAYYFTAETLAGAGTSWTLWFDYQ